LLDSLIRAGWHDFCSRWWVNVRQTSRSVDVSGRAPERRHHHRALVGASAWLLAFGDRHDAECVNVSMGGAAVRTRAALRVGTPLSFELSLGSDRGSIAIEAEVVRVAEGELGLRFVALDRASLEALLQLV
jgi:PilZ domain